MNSSLVLLVLVSVIVTVQNAAAHEKFYAKAAAITMNIDCLGEGFNDWINLVERAVLKCNQREKSSSSRYTGNDASNLNNADWNKVFAQFYSQGSRNKRSMHFTASKIQKIKRKMEKKVRVFRCVMKEVKVTGSNNEVDPQLLARQYDDLTNLPSDLRRDIQEAIFTCHQASKCLPTDKPNNPIPGDVIRTKFFLHCEKMYRYGGCVKQIVKPFMNTIDLSGLEGSLDHLESDEARAAEILYAGSKVGYDDFDLLL